MGAFPNDFEIIIAVTNRKEGRMENIWTYEENQAVKTEMVDMKPFKPTGKFFDDIQTLVRMFNIKTHPALRESTYRPVELGSNGSLVNESTDE